MKVHKAKFLYGHYEYNLCMESGRLYSKSVTPRWKDVSCKVCLAKRPQRSSGRGRKKK